MLVATHAHALFMMLVYNGQSPFGYIVRFLGRSELDHARIVPLYGVVILEVLSDLAQLLINLIGVHLELGQ